MNQYVYKMTPSEWNQSMSTSPSESELRWMMTTSYLPWIVLRWHWHVSSHIGPSTVMDTWLSELYSVSEFSRDITVVLHQANSSILARYSRHLRASGSLTRLIHETSKASAARSAASMISLKLTTSSPSTSSSSLDSLETSMALFAGVKRLRWSRFVSNWESLRLKSGCGCTPSTSSLFFNQHISHK